MNSTRCSDSAPAEGSLNGEPDGQHAYLRRHPECRAQFVQPADDRPQHPAMGVRYRAELRKTRELALSAQRRELAKVDRGIERIVGAIKEGLRWPTMKEELDQLNQRHEELAAGLAERDNRPEPLIHPTLAERYKREVRQLVEALNDPFHRGEAAGLLRKLVGQIVLKPNQNRTGLLIDLHGDLAGILQVSDRSRKATMDAKYIAGSEKEKALQLQGPLAHTKLVAGTRNPLRDEFENFQSLEVVAGAGFSPNFNTKKPLRVVLQPCRYGKKLLS